MEKAYDPSRVLYIDGKKLFGYWMLLENVPGVLADVSKVFAEENVNIVRILAVSIDEVADALFYCDFTESIGDPYEVLERLSRAKGIREVQLIEPIIPGLLIDTVHSLILISGARYILVREDALGKFVKDMRERLGSAGEAFLYYAGLDLGNGMWNGLRHYTEGVIDRLRIFALFLQSSGYGKFEADYDIEGRRANIKVYDSIECVQGVGSDRPFSQLIRGIIAGCFENIFGKGIKVEEVKCMAKGDEYCEFIVGEG